MFQHVYICSPFLSNLLHHLCNNVFIDKTITIQIGRSNNRFRNRLSQHTKMMTFKTMAFNTITTTKGPIQIITRLKVKKDLFQLIQRTQNPPFTG